MTLQKGLSLLIAAVIVSLATVFLALADTPVAGSANYTLDRDVEAAGDQSSSASYQLAGQAAGEATTIETSTSTSYKLRSGYHFTVNTSSSGGGDIYLPLIFKNFAPGPDLVIDSLTATGSGVEVVIRNAGTVATSDDFWVDVYFNPNPAPPGINQPWQSSAPAGANWGVTARLDPGQSLTLVTGGAYYVDGSSTFPAGANVYAYVDSINYATTYGNIQETSEGNNVFGPVISTAGSGAAVVTSGGLSSLEGLPQR